MLREQDQAHLILDTLLKAFPKRQLPKSVPAAAFSLLVCSNPMWGLRRPNLTFGKLHIAHLGSCRLGNCHLGSRPWINAHRKENLTPIKHINDLQHIKWGGVDPPPSPPEQKNLFLVFEEP